MKTLIETNNPFSSFSKEDKNSHFIRERFFEKERLIGGKKVIISQTSADELSDLISTDLLIIVKDTLSGKASSENK